VYSKTKIFNLALGALLLSRQVADADTDASNECKVLLQFWDVALRATLSDLDMDSTATQAALELVEEDPNDLWGYANKNPTRCLKFRRIQSSLVTDTRSTHISKKIGIHDGQKVIFCNIESAIGEYISTEVPLSALNAAAGLALAHRLASLASPLIAGKGAKGLRESLEEKYKIFKAEACEQDKLESLSFEDDDVMSEFVEERTT
jgi:hypothetical protein